MGSYICRRRLTEAAKMLVFTDCSVLDIAVSAGFGSQQAFSAAFKRMFKKTPRQYRADKEFWPLQSRLALDRIAHHSDSLVTRFAVPSDEEEWMILLDQVMDGYPHLNESDFVAHLRCTIDQREALICESDGQLVGALTFNRDAAPHATRCRWHRLREMWWCLLPERVKTVLPARLPAGLSTLRGRAVAAELPWPFLAAWRTSCLITYFSACSIWACPVPPGEHRRVT